MKDWKVREIGEIYVTGKNCHRRRFIKTIDGVVSYALYVAKNNPHICGEWFQGCEVHHKDFDRLNDAPENLVVLTTKEHNKIHSEHLKQNSPYAKSVIGWYRHKVIGIWNSQSNASRDTGCSQSSICYHCKNRKPLIPKYWDYKWMYLDEYLAEWWEKEMEKAVFN